MLVQIANVFGDRSSLIERPPARYKDGFGLLGSPLVIDPDGGAP